jgi:hypothetical protein
MWIIIHVLHPDLVSLVQTKEEFAPEHTLNLAIAHGCRIQTLDFIQPLQQSGSKSCNRLFLLLGFQVKLLQEEIIFSFT